MTRAACIRTTEALDSECGQSKRFMLSTAITYLCRVLEKRSVFNDEVFSVFHWLVGSELINDNIGDFASILGDLDMEEFRTVFEDEINDSQYFGRTMEKFWRRLRTGQKSRLFVTVWRLLRTRQDQIQNAGRSDLEDRILSLKRMFGLDDLETEICIFLFITAVFDDLQALFIHHLNCNDYIGREHLARILNTNEGAITRAANGKLLRTGILEQNYSGAFALESSFISILQNSTALDLQTAFFHTIDPVPIPLDFHEVDKAVTEHALALLRLKPESPTHILIYGPPGTGKTSYAYGLGKKLGLCIYLADHGGKDGHSMRERAITACVNMTAGSDSSVIIGDDCDLVLGTRNSWQLFGTSTDKKWLHDVLETPGVRMLWIANSTGGLEESVMRRFSFSIKFEPFKRSQRVRLWERTIQTHKLKRYFDSAALVKLADRFDVNPGVIEQSVRKVAESSARTKRAVHKALNLTLEAYETLSLGGRKTVPLGMDVDDISLDALNISGGDINNMLRKLKAYIDYAKLQGAPAENTTMSLLFHGPPGSGKSYLARYIAHHLDRAIVCKRPSDILSKWVGETEQNIRDVYDEAERKEAILVFDEADSLIFSRDRATHSWESSFTNEFLTSMERFRGVQIFTTNRMKDMDAATMRRFTIKLEFGYLKPEGRIVFYRNLLCGLVSEIPDAKVYDQLGRLANLTPGDFKAVRDRFRFEQPGDVDHEALVGALRAESEIKAAHAGGRTLGFVA